MNNVIRVQDFLEVQAQDYAKLAEYLDKVAGTIPDHKRVTSRILAGIEYDQDKRDEPYCYIGETSGKAFCIRHTMHVLEYDVIRSKYETERFDLVAGSYTNPVELTPADLRTALTDRAKYCREYAVKLLAEVEGLPKAYKEYEAAVLAYNTAKDAMSYAARDALGIKSVSIY